MQKNTILVVMPVYNAEATLEKAIDSILAQSHKDLLLVIVDDNSTDSSLEIAKTFLGDKRVRVYSNKINMGAYYCRNFGIYVSKNMHWRYFTTHDSDDISFPHRYKSLLRRFTRYPNVNGIQDTFDRIDLKTGRTLKSKITMAHAVFRRAVFEELGYFDNVRFGGDWEHWYRLNKLNSHTENSNRTLSVTEIMGESYVHDANLTVQIPEFSPRRERYVARSKNKIEKLFRLRRWHYSFEPEPGTTKEIKDASS